MTPLKLQLRRNAVRGSAVILAALTIAGIAVVPSAGADQLSNEQAYAQELTSQIAALGVREAALGEQYDAGVVALHQANARVAAAAKALASAKASQRKTVVLLRQDAVQAYVGGGPALELAGPVALANVNQALLRQELEQTFASHESDALDSFQFAAAEESTAQAGLVLARDADRRRVASLESDRQQVMATQNRLVGVQQQVKGQIATLVAEIQRCRAAGRTTSRGRPAGPTAGGRGGGRGSGCRSGRGASGRPEGSSRCGPPAARTTASGRTAGGPDPASGSHFS